jgi:PAS domain S-box-containing protein
MIPPPNNFTSSNPSPLSKRQLAEEIYRERNAQLQTSKEPLNPDETQRLIHELQVHQIELEMQNDELRRAELELLSSKERYIDLYDLAPVGYCTLDEDGVLRDVNLTAATLLATDRSILLNQPIHRYIAKDDQDAFYLFRKKLSHTDQPDSLELRMIKSSGLYFWAKLDVTIRRTSGTRITSVVIQDISLSKLAADRLKQSETLSLSILNSVSANIAVIDRTGYIIAVNDPWRRFATENGMSGGMPAPYTDVGSDYLGACGDEGSAARIGIQAVLHGNLPYYELEYPCDSPTEQRWFRMRVTPLGSEKEGAVIFHTDITSQKSKEREDNFILSALGIGVWKWDLVTNALYWDENMYKLYGIEPTDFSGIFDAWESALSPETKERTLAEINAAIRGEKDFDTTFQATLKSGKVQEIRTLAFVRRSPDGTPLAMHGINVDRNREAELELTMATERAKALQNVKLAALGEMSAGIAHEINNPLTIIAGNILLLKKLVDTPEKFDAKIKSITKSVARIDKIVRGLQKYARSTVDTIYKVENLSEIVHEAIQFTEEKSKRFSVPITVGISADLQIYCDASEVEQVLVNLINNGIDASKNLNEKWVKINFFESDGCPVLQVIDSGLGISDAVLAKLFQPFFTTKPIGEGTGLGLSISKGIIEGHRATLKVNHEFKNTCFEIRFPRIEKDKIKSVY